MDYATCLSATERRTTTAKRDDFHSKSLFLVKKIKDNGTQKAVQRQRIGLYRDVWIAAIASSRKSLATQTAAICVRFHGRRVRHVYVTMQITFLARKSALIYRRGLRQRVASLTIDCNGVFAIRAYGNFAMRTKFSERLDLK